MGRLSNNRGNYAAASHSHKAASKATATKNHRSIKKGNGNENQAALSGFVTGKQKLVRAALVETTNATVCDVLSNKSMNLRRQKVNKNYAETSLSSSSESIFKSGAINSPRTTLSGVKGFATRNVSVEKISSKGSNLKNIEEMDKEGSQLSVAEKSTSKKLCVYTNTEIDVVKPVTDMLPEDKLKIYEYEIDNSEPKQVKKKRNRRPRKRNVKKHFKSDDDSISISLATKLSELTTNSSPATSQEKSTGYVTKSKYPECHFTPTIIKEKIMSTLIPTPNNGQEMVSISGATKSTQELPASSTPICVPCNKSVLAPAPDLSNSCQAGCSKSTDSVDTVTPPNLSPLIQHDKHHQSNTRSFLSPSRNSFNTLCSISTNLSSSGLFEENETEPSSHQDYRHVNITLRRKVLGSSLSKERTSELQSVIHPDRDDNVTKRRKILSSTAIEDSDAQASFNNQSSFFNSPLRCFVTMRSKFQPNSSNHQLQMPEKSMENILKENSNCFGFEDDMDSDDDNCALEQSSSVTSSFARRTPAVPALANRERFLTKNKTISTSISTEDPASTPGARVPVPTYVSTNSVNPSTSCETVQANTSPGLALLFRDPQDLTPVSFADNALPLHFNKPPRRSYERLPRKRRYISDEETTFSDTEAPACAPNKKKKKNNNKVYKKKETKASNDWLASISAQFAEIENVKLCVE